MKALLAKGVNISAKGKDGYTPLLKAIHNRQTDTAKFLIEKGAIDATGENGSAALYQAALTSNFDIINDSS